MMNYFETDHYIFVHGWIPDKEMSPKSDWRLGDWTNARWDNGMLRWIEGNRVENKTIVCGHWHTSWGHANLHHDGPEIGKGANFSPFYDDGIIALDGCTAYSGIVNCIVIED